jgi:hypothetical protein
MSQINPVRTTPSYLSEIHFNIILSLRLSLRSDKSYSAFPTRVLYASIVSPIHATWPAHLILPDLIILIIFGEEYKLWSCFLCSFYPAVYCFIQFQFRCAPQHPFLRDPHLRSSLNTKDKFSRLYKTTVLRIFNFTFLESRPENEKVLNWMESSNAQTLSAPNASWIKCLSVTFIFRYFNFATFSKDLLGSYML